MCGGSLVLFLYKRSADKEPDISMSHGKQEEKRMEMILQMLLLVLGFLMLVKGADWFVDGASGIAERFGIPQLVVGLTIVAMGTSMPEAAVSINRR